MNNDINRRRLLSIASLFGMGLVFVTNPLTHIVYRGVNDSTAVIALRGFAGPIHMALLVGAVYAVTQLLRSRADVMGLIGGTLTIMGWAVGVRILAIGQIESLLANGSTPFAADTMDRIFQAVPIVWASIVPVGLLFPIGLVTLGITIAATRPIPRAIGVLLAVGGVLFPIGRIGGFPWALMACDLTLGLTFLAIGWQVLRQPATSLEGTVLSRNRSIQPAMG